MLAASIAFLVKLLQVGGKSESAVIMKAAKFMFKLVCLQMVVLTPLITFNFLLCEFD